MDVTIDTRSDLVSGVSDLRHVPLSTLVRTREAQINRSAEIETATASFNSSI